MIKFNLYSLQGPIGLDGPKGEPVISKRHLKLVFSYLENYGTHSCHFRALYLLHFS